MNIYGFFLEPFFNAWFLLNRTILTWLIFINDINEQQYNIDADNAFPRQTDSQSDKHPQHVDNNYSDNLCLKTGL